MLQGQKHHDQDSGSAADPAETPQGREPGPMSLYVAGDRSRFEPLVHALGELGARLESDVDAVTGALVRETGGRVLVLYPNPVMTLAGRLDQGDSLSATLNAWRNDTERLLALFRRNRSRITLVDGHAALEARDEFRQQLGNRWSLAIPALDAECTEDPRHGLGFLHLVAAQALEQDEAAAALLAELDASSLVLGPRRRIDLQALIDDTSPRAVSPEFEEIRKENELMRLQLRQLQAVYDSRVLGDRRMGEIRTEIKRARLARKSIEADFSEAREAWRAERKQLTDKLKWTADDLAAIRRSLSWRVTAPLRRVLGIFLGGSRL
jgi:hypothetical protein